MRKKKESVNIAIIAKTQTAERSVIKIAQQLKVTESDIQKAIRDYLQWQGWFVVKIHQSLGSYKGIADLYALKDGQHVWIEVKTDRGRQSEYQEQFEQDIRDHGGRYIVARGIEDIEKYLKGEM